MSTRSVLHSRVLLTTLTATMLAAAGCAPEPEQDDLSEEATTETGEALSSDGDGGVISREPEPLRREALSEARPEVELDRTAAPEPLEGSLERAARVAPGGVVRVLIEPEVAPFDFAPLRGAAEGERQAHIADRKARIAPAHAAISKRVVAAGGRVLGQSWLSAQITAEMTAREALALRAQPGIKDVAFDEATSESATYDGQDIRDNTLAADLLSSGYDGIAGGRTGGRVRIGVIESNGGTNYPCKDHVGFKSVYGGSSRLLNLYNCNASGCTTTTSENNSNTHASAVLWAAGGDLTDGQDSAITNATERVRRSGVAPESYLYYYSDGGNCDGVVTALGQAVADGVDVVNMSLSVGDACDTAITCANTAIKNATDAGVLVVTAAGNAGHSGACTLAYPALRTETIAVANIASNDATAYDSLDLDGSSSMGKVPITTRSGYSTTTAGVDISAPGWHTLTFSGEPNLYFTGTWSGTSMASPVMAGNAALLKHAFYDMGWTSAGNNPRALAVNLLLSGDSWDEVSNTEPTSGVSPTSGYGRVRMHWPSSSSINGPWAWGWRAFTIQQGETVSWVVGSAGPESTSVTEWKWALLWFEDNLASTSDIVTGVYDTCPAGGGSPVLVAGDYSYGMRKRVRLTSSQIGGKCLEMRATAYLAPPGGTVVYSADYFHGGSTAGH